MRRIQPGNVAAGGNKRKQQPLLEMTEQKPNRNRQTQHQRLPQCIVDFRVVNQPAPHEGKTKTAYCQAIRRFTDLTGTVDDDSFTVRGDQVLIFQHFQDAANGLAGASDDLTNFLAGNFNLHTVRVGHRIRLFSQVQ